MSQEQIPKHWKPKICLIDRKAQEEGVSNSDTKGSYAIITSFSI